jgi:hypothetical protein
MAGLALAPAPTAHDLAVRISSWGPRTPDPLDPVSLRLARRLAESAIGAHSTAR